MIDKQQTINQQETKKLNKNEYEICESCLTCKHFLWKWDDIPFCALGKNIYGYCDQPEMRRSIL